MPVLPAIVGIGLLMMVHELGHSLAAVATGVSLLEFSLGFGPKLFSFKRGKTQFSIRLLPFWAYAALEDRSNPPGRGFLEQSVWKRMVVALGGPLASVLLAAILFTSVFSILGIPQPVPTVAGLVSGSPAEAAGLKPGDRITHLDGVAVRNWEEAVAKFRASPGTKVRVTVMRNGESVSMDVVPVIGEAGYGVVGIYAAMEMRKEGILAALRDGFLQTVMVVVGWVRTLAMAVTGKIPLELMGPVGMGQLIGEASRSGLWDALFLIGHLSAVVGLGNLLPLPMLDGGRLAFLIAEAIRGKPVDPEKENLVHAIGFAIFMALGILVMFRDIQRLIT